MKTGFFRRTLLASACVSLFVVAGCGDDEGDGTQTGSAIENAAGSALIDITAGSPIDKPFRISNGDAGDLARFNALMDSADSAPFQVGNAAFDDNLGALVLTGISNTEEGRVFTIGRAELFDVNFDYLEALRAEETVTGLQEVFRKVRLYDVSLSGHETLEFNGTIDVAAVEFDRMQMDSAMAGEDPLSGEGFSLGGFFLKDLAAEGVGDETMSFGFAVDDLRLSDLARGAVGPMVFKNLEYTVEQDVEAMIAELENADGGAGPMAYFLDTPFRDMFFPAEQRIVMAAGKWDGMNLSGVLDAAANEELPSIDEDGLVSFGKFETADMESWINGKRYSYTEYAMMEPVEFAWLIPSKIRMTSRGSVADMTALVDESETEMLAILREHGFDDLPSEGEFLWTYDPDEGAAALTYDVDMPGHAAIDVNYAVSGLTLQQVNTAITTQNPLLLAGLSIDGMTIRFDDEKLLDGIMAIAAHETDQTPEELRASLPALIALGSSQASQMVPEVSDYAASLTTFLTEGGTLEIAMSPESPVPLMTLGLLSQTSPQMIPSTLALTVTHEE
ncbi:hypothetical protein [Aquisalinus flavus]|uniref:Lipoprotein n=1 Tax=Aquisalinus flavus TaxID=1526572 RepID=A0A8J2V4L2_9PROT|nr:hypothetical protein [Aquisalinus flavus]MBD0427011.1 hypothetical protein [Aquisalinus flavus]UNE46841.1 hypothetical protein FF099_01595 [Aquisalinus flavus]GGC97671.1 hypothetical protein GCM10011342_03250 [Aquisalinus flavus]